VREIVIDTETTGLDPLNGDRIVEIGAVELINRSPTGQTFYRYLNPEGFYLLSDARQFLFEGAPTVYDIAVRLGCSSLPRVATDAFFCSRNALTASLHSII